MQKAIAVDVGNAQIRAGIVRVEADPQIGLRPVHGFDNLRRLGIEGLRGEQWALETKQLNPEVIEKIAEMCEALANSQSGQIHAVGVACAAAFDKGGLIHPTQQAHNSFPTSFSDPVSDRLSQMLGSQVHIAVGNRSKMAAWGELRWGCGRELPARNLIYISLGGNIGCGIIVNGRPLLGQFGFAGELGHMIVDPKSSHECTLCHQRGCISALASGRAAVRDLIDQIGQPGWDEFIYTMETSLSTIEAATHDAGHIEHLGESVTAQISFIDARSIFQAASRINSQTGKPEAPISHGIIQEVAKHLGKLVAELVCILDPAVVVLGGVASECPLLEEIVAEEARRYMPGFRKQKTDLQITRLGDRAPLYGAALWALEHPSES